MYWRADFCRLKGRARSSNFYISFLWRKNVPWAFIKLILCSNKKSAHTPRKALSDATKVDRAPMYVTVGASSIDWSRIWFTLHRTRVFPESEKRWAREEFSQHLNNENSSRRSRDRRERNKKNVKTNKFSFCVRATWGENLTVAKQKLRSFDCARPSSEDTNRETLRARVLQKQWGQLGRRTFCRDDFYQTLAIGTCRRLMKSIREVARHVEENFGE